MKAITLVDVSISNPPTIPVGPLYIAAVLRREGYEVDLRDYAVSSYADLDPVGLVSSLKDSADTIGVSCMSDTLPFVATALRDVKQAWPDKVLVLGGPGPSGVPRKILEKFPFVDIVVVGEGEDTILEVMKCLTEGDRSDLKLVGGICYRDGDDIRMTAPRERIRNLDDLPLPLYESVPMERYPLVNMVFSRGCPYRCSFCDVAPMWGRKNFRRSIDGVVAELRFLRDKYGKTDFEFTDETFVLSPDVISDFCDRLKSEGLEIEWACTGRVNLMTRALLAEMKSAGCKAIFYGIESGSESVLKRVSKDFSPEEAVEVIYATARKMRTVASFIWGFPFESHEDLMRTLLLMVYVSQIGVDARLNRLAPFALTPLYEEYGDSLVRFEEQGSFSPADPFRAQAFRGDIPDLIGDFPEVFPEFYWFPTDGLSDKNRIVRSLDRHWDVMDWRVRFDLGMDICRTC